MIHIIAFLSLEMPGRILGENIIVSRKKGKTVIVL